MSDFENIFVGAVVFDISDRLEKDGRTRLDVAKEAFIEFVAERDAIVGSSNGMPKNQGQSVADLAVAQSTKSVHWGLKGMLAFMANVDIEERHLFYVTDRFRPETAIHIRKAMNLSVKNDLNTMFHLIGLPGADRSLVELESESCTVVFCGLNELSGVLQGV